MTCNTCNEPIDPKQDVKVVTDLGDSVEMHYTCDECGSIFYCFICEADWQPFT